MSAHQLLLGGGGATLCRVPAAELGELRQGQLAVLGVPVDDGVGVQPGARFGPSAIRQADDGIGPASDRRHVDLGVHPFVALDVVDLGDLAVVPGDPHHNLALVERTLREIVGSGALPVVLGGDHSIAYATIKGAAEAAVAPHVVQFDAHTDTATTAGRPEWSHGSPMWRLFEEGVLAHGGLTQFGLRGWWPGDAEIAWARERGIAWWTAREVHRMGLHAAVDALLERVSPDAPVWLSVDVDVADPACAPGTGTAEPGGLASWELLDAVSRVARERELVGVELVEVSPLNDPAGITAMLAHRTILEALTGIAERRERAGADGLVPRRR